MVLGSRDLREREGGELGLHVVFTGLSMVFIGECGFYSLVQLLLAFYRILGFGYAFDFLVKSGSYRVL